jgi:DNA-binding winged helix-turn-helix (wHTH) protein/tetratricopeptide (TPR) repeat protein
MTPPRTRLLKRMNESEARLIRLIAPAGYGKSSLVRLFARRFGRFAICDCAGVAGPIDFAGRAMSALAGETPGGADGVALERLRLHAIEADAATMSRALLEVWKSRREQALFVLEHAEAIAENSGVLALLGDLLAARPDERVILVSSRVALPLRFANYLAPHQILTLAQEDLRFNAEEPAGFFEGTDLSPETIDRIVRLADGRPIVLLLLARFAQYDSDIERLIDRLGDVPSADVYAYLANEVLSAIMPDMLSTLLAAAAIPNASLEDVTAATGIRHATPIVDWLLHLPGFISSETGTYQTHPLLLAALLARYGVELHDYLFRAANAYERSGEYVRAAELYDAYGDLQAAAGALDRLPPAALERPSARTIGVLTQIKMSTLCAYPNLWIATLPYRRPTVEPSRLFDEAVKLLQSMSPDADSSLRQRLLARLAMLAAELGRLDEAQGMIASIGFPEAFEDAPEERRRFLMTSAIVASKRGRFKQADELIDACDAVSSARHVRFDGERSQIARERARLLGDWDDALKISEEALYAAQRSGITSRIVDAARAVAQDAWYCNDDARVVAANQLLEDCGDTEARSFARYVESALLRGAADAPARLLQLARWHAALATTDLEHAKDLFDRAIEGIDEIEDVFLQVAIRVSAALLLSTHRRRLLEARIVAQRVESPPMQASLELLIDSPEPLDYGIFKHVAARAARSPLRARRAGLAIDAVRGHVRRGAELLHVSERGFELLVALALLPGGGSKEELAGAIWPGLDGDAALNSLKMCVSRTRAQIGEKEAIVNTRRGYALSDRVTIDVREYERLLRSVRGAATLNDPVRRQVQETIRTLAERERAHTARWPWFEPHAAHLAALERELVLVIAQDAQRQGDRVPAL